MPKDLPSGYASNYRERARALRYLGKYETQWTKRFSTGREKALLVDLLREAAARTGPLDRMLDIPCGPGRLVSAYAPVPRRLVVADVSPAMVGLARENTPPVPDLAVSGVCLDGLSLPFADRSFDCVISIRLAHHLRGEEPFRRYLSELMRVSAKAVLFTFFSSRSVKNRLRGMAVALGQREPKNAVDPRQVKEWARQQGFEWLEARPLSRVASGHWYTLLARKESLAEAWDLARLEPMSARGGVFRLSAGASRWAVLKRYPAWCLRSRRAGLARAHGEWEALLALRAAGARVVRPLAAWGEGSGPARRGVLITEEIRPATTLRDLARSGGSVGQAERGFQEAARQIALLHGQGWVLIDSFAKNVLVEPGVGGGPTVTLIDLPHAFRWTGGNAAKRGGRVVVAQVWDIAKLFKGVRPFVGPNALRTALRAYLESREHDCDVASVEALAARVEGALRLKEGALNAALVGAKRLVRRSLRFLST